MRRRILGTLFVLSILAFAMSLPGWTAVQSPKPADGPTGGDDPQIPAAGPWASAAVLACPGCAITNFQRAVISGDIVHYSFQLQIGPGAYDRIGLHRVVKEKRPFEPIRTRDGLFMIPGGWYRFDKLFLAALDDPSIPDTHAFPVFLAQNNYDVWGIDLAWSLVPSGLPDYSFMSAWGMEKDARDTRIGLGVARAMRGLSGSGPGPMSLLGFSVGYMVGFVAVEQETQLPPGLRHIKAYVPMDGYFDCEACRENACAVLAVQKEQMTSGIWIDPSGELLNALGYLGATSPDDPSPILPGVTNLQAALFFTAQTWLFSPENPHYHFFAGTVDETGFPTGLQYTPVGSMLSWLQGASYSLPLREYADWNEVLCAQTDTPLDDHLGDITIPIFFVASAGGTGDYGVPTLSLLGSKDVSYTIVRLWPVGQETMDFAHLDLWLAGNAEEMAWQPILKWLNKH